mgnify:FL=1
MRVKIVVAFMGEIGREPPAMAFDPVQAAIAVSLLAVQVVVLVELQVRVDEPPVAMEVGAAVRVTIGALAALTVTVAVLVTVPPGPVHCMV